MKRAFWIFLAAIMLVGAFAALPASAEANVRTAGFDGTTSDYTSELLITEILVNSKTGDKDLDDQMKEGDVATWFSPDAFDYVEIYNASNTEIDLYDYAIVRSRDSTFFKEGSENLGLFTGKLRLGNWPLQQHPDAPNAAFNNLFDCVTTNPENGAWLEPGEFAVIWFYGSGTMELTSKLGGPIDADDFRTHYGMPEDTMVIAVPGKSSYGPSFDLAPGYTYALVRYDFNLSERVVTSAWSDAPELTPNGESVVCMFDYIPRNAVGILFETDMDDMATYYVPANCKPDVLNAINQICLTEEEKAAYVELNDYVEANFTQTYRSSAILSFTEEPSPGTMPAWQWAYVDPIGETNVVGGVTLAHGLQSLSATAGDGNEYEAAMKALVTDWATNDAIKDADGKLNVTETDGKYSAVAWSETCVEALVTERSDVITYDGVRPEVKFDYAAYLAAIREWWKEQNNQSGETGDGSGSQTGDGSGSQTGGGSGSQTGGGSGSESGDGSGSNTNQSTGNKPSTNKNDNSKDKGDGADEHNGQNNSEEGSKKGISTGAVVGIVLGAVLLLVIGIAVAFAVGSSKKKATEKVLDDVEPECDDWGDT